MLPTVMMPSVGVPKNSPTTGLAPKSVLHQPVQIPRSPAPSEEELDCSGGDAHDLYDDLPSLDSTEHSHISLEDLGMGDRSADPASHVTHSTMAGTV